jgi:mono/diheme cytochrome c family protein
MSFFPLVAQRMLLAFAVLTPITGVPQAKQETPTKPALTEQQRVGKGLFSQNCSLCHSPTKKNEKSVTEEGTTIGPRLNGLFSGPKALPDAVAKTFIQRGVPEKMPGFQYGLDAKEIDAIIAYLKTL